MKKENLFSFFLTESAARNYQRWAFRSLKRKAQLTFNELFLVVKCLPNTEISKLPTYFVSVFWSKSDIFWSYTKQAEKTCVAKKAFFFSNGTLSIVSSFQSIIVYGVTVTESFTMTTK